MDFKRFFNTIIFLFFFICCYSQQRSVFIRDSLTKEAIPFTAIQFIDKKGGVYTDENGKGIIADSITTILVSQIGYGKKYINLNTSANEITLLLAKKSIILPEVVISNHPAKSVEIGYAKLSGKNGVIASPNTNFAVFIPYDNSWINPPAIHSIVIDLDDIKGSKKYPSAKCNICFDLRLPDKNGLPSDISLLEQRIINNSTKIYHGRETVKLPNPIVFPTHGIFIVIDYITPNNSNPRLLINPTIYVTGRGNTNQTWSRNIAYDFQWKKIDLQDERWGSLIPYYYGKNATVMNIKAGLEITY